MKLENIGSPFDSWLQEEGIYEEVTTRAIKRVLARQVQASGLTLREYLWHWEVTGTPPGASTSAVTSTTAGDSAGDADAESGEGGGEG